MGGKTEKILTTIFYFVLFSVMLMLILQNLADPWTFVMLSGLLLLSFTFRNAVVYGSRDRRGFGRLLLLLDAVIILLIGYYDKSGSSVIYYFVIIADACIAYSFRFGSMVSAICFLLATFENLIFSGLVEEAFVSSLVYDFLAFTSVTAVMFIVRYEIGQREKVANIMYELKVKTKQLENAYMKLKETSEELEEVTALRERNRIAREIHDTVGHTLTTVLLEMEAGERLLGTDRELALEKFGLAKGQVRKGLNDIRESVSTLKAGSDMLDLVSSLKLLIGETIRHGGIHVKYDIPAMPELSAAQKKAIYRALQEGLTNGIKHGKSTAFVFILKYEDSKIKLLLQDNGRGTDKVVQGFGLTSMSERVRELGGTVCFESGPGEGFSIKISIPVKLETVVTSQIGGVVSDGQDKDTDS